MTQAINSSRLNAFILGLMKVVSDPMARDKCVAEVEITGGQCLLSTQALETALLDSQKGQRCDNCFQLPSQNQSLKRCSGCGSYWYCDDSCQATQWKSHHRRICKTYNAYVASPEFNVLAQHQKMDAIMLSHLMARLSLDAKPYEIEDESSANILLSLLPSPGAPTFPGHCPVKPSPPHQMAETMYERFGNNNFAIHTHLTTVGHGVFPLASRLFNHSCSPNAAAKYIFPRGNSVEMQVVSLRTILPGEEICLTYLDPALTETREKVLQITYGFECRCPSSVFLRRIGRIPDIPQGPADLALLEIQLREHVALGLNDRSTLMPTPMDSLPSTLRCLLHESYMQSLSERFSKASHEGQYEVALESGLTLLSLYMIVYPENYPQIGMHLLELTKTAWNNIATSVDLNLSQQEQVRFLLAMCRRVLTVFGREGDEGGPLEEIETLDRLLKDEEALQN
ncbi:hypothetical protein D9619_007076 [Psilocybe cf. subviscida]|uniref:SET domain-containing protein n=1 Tax=Psilocybe cf. subviscida TaxID=2480587 RepID=A0A8H5B263_9AGAR|nr:hypothetical protein D9619_007076 [Psilocybe cf. subviscida]